MVGVRRRRLLVLCVEHPAAEWAGVAGRAELLEVSFVVSWAEMKLAMKVPMLR